MPLLAAKDADGIKKRREAPVLGMLVEGLGLSHGVGRVFVGRGSGCRLKIVSLLCASF